MFNFITQLPSETCVHCLKSPPATFQNILFKHWFFSNNFQTTLFWTDRPYIYFCLLDTSVQRLNTKHYVLSWQTERAHSFSPDKRSGKLKMGMSLTCYKRKAQCIRLWATTVVSLWILTKHQFLILLKNAMRAFGFRLMLHFTFHVFLFFFFFFFSLRVNSNLTWVTVHHCSYTVHVLKNIKNGSHDTIYTFKNCFATMFSVFSFQQ